MMTRHQVEPTAHSISVDIRLCGSVPRKDMIQSPTCLISALTTPGSTPPFCSMGARTGEGTSHSRQMVGLPSLTLQNKNNISTIPRYLQPSQAIEPPEWAVPARGETSLEVSFTRFQSTDYQHPNLPFISPFVNHWDGSAQLI